MFCLCHICLSVSSTVTNKMLFSLTLLSVSRLSLVVDGINMNRSSGGGGGGDGTGTIYEIRGRRMDCSCFYVH